MATDLSPPLTAPPARDSAASVPTTRERLIKAMSDALQRRGLHGVGLNDVLRAANAPKGVLYHHFPGGKTALAVAALDAYVARLGASLDRALAGEAGAPPADPVPALARWLEAAVERASADGFARGCPLAVVALESTPADTELRRALADAFAAVRARIAHGLAAAGHEASDASALAALVVAAYEGGLLQARAAGSVEPMAQATRALLALLGPRPRAGIQAGTR
jgi:TetR/AcrR family transcriptional repressor of lmrAB and yxaGH operons